MTDDDLTVELSISDGRTVIDVAGSRAAALVVWSGDGQRIYLPPEDFDDPPRREGAYGSADGPVGSGDTPYDGPRGDSPYESAVADDSAYQRAGGPPEEEGLYSTADGFRVVHPEPVTEFRLLR